MIGEVQGIPSCFSVLSSFMYDISAGSVAIAAVMQNINQEGPSMNGVRKHTLKRSDNCVRDEDILDESPIWFRKTRMQEQKVPETNGVPLPPRRNDRMNNRPQLLNWAPSIQHWNGTRQAMKRWSKLQAVTVLDNK